MNNINGQLSAIGDLHGGLSALGGLNGIIAKPQAGVPYDGDYEVTPSAETQTLPTQGKVLSDDIVVNPIELPYADISGTTATASTVRSGFKFVDANGVLTTGRYAVTQSWSQVAILENGRQISNITISQEQTSTLSYKLSSVPNQSRAIWVAIRRSGSSSSNTFLGSDTIYIVPDSLSFSPNAIITAKRSSNGRTIANNTYSSNTAGICSGTITIQTTEPYNHTISILVHPSSSMLVSGSYGIYVFYLSYPSVITPLTTL